LKIPPQTVCRQAVGRSCPHSISKWLEIIGCCDSGGEFLDSVVVVGTRLRGSESGDVDGAADLRPKKKNMGALDETL